MPRTSVDLPEAHYDDVTQAWRHLMGESFHYGFFSSTESELDTATEELTRLMATRGELGAEHSVLDVGCGIGGPAMFLARNIGCQVTGISTSVVGIEVALENAAEHGLGDRLAFCVRDGMSNEFDDASFDRIWIMESSHLMSDKGAMIRDSCRVLKPGGRLVLCDIITHRDLPIKDVLKRAAEFDLLRRVFGRAKMETLVSYRGWCEEVGLVVEGLDDISAEVAPTFDCWKANAEQYRDEVVTLIGDRSWSEFHRACDELKTMWNDGILGYGLIAASKP
jgi:27-O-demethylrifamycin SV methyltransferase